MHKPTGSCTHSFRVLSATAPKPHEIAVLYKGKGDLLDALVAEIADSPIPYLLERDARFPTTPLTRWLQRCATKALGGVEAESLGELANTYRDLLELSGAFEDDLITRCRLLDALASSTRSSLCIEWITSVDDALGLGALLAADGTTQDEVDALDQIRRTQSEPVALLDFAHGVQVRGRVVATTCHASKGRQFDVVILPGLQKSLFPFARWQNGAYRLRPLPGRGPTVVLRWSHPSPSRGSPGLLATVHQPLGSRRRGSLAIR